MKTSKRDSRKPEMAIYRPGMGLQNKNKSEDKRPSKSASPDTVILDQINTLIKSSENENESNQFQQELSKVSKNAKNRRPDIKVYTPKPKIAELNSKKSENKSVCQQSTEYVPESIKNSTRKKSPTPDVDANSSTKRNNSKMQNKSCPNKNSLPAENGHDVEDSDVSISRSSPEKSHNSFTDDTVNSSSVKEDKSKRNRKKQDPATEDTKKHVVNLTEKSEKTTISPVSVSNELPHVEQNCNKTTSIEKSGPLHFDKEKYQSQTCGSTQIRSTSFDSKTKQDRKKRIDNLPPRFQKNKNQDGHINASSKYSSGSTGGGILKLPADFERCLNISEPIENPVFVPKMFHEPIFIHKTLFDPNNPSKPEVINIPAPHPPPIPFCNMNYSPEASSFMTHSMKNLGYIPPPQPPILYEMPNVNTSHAHEGFLNKTDIIPAPVPTQVFCRPNMPFSDIVPVLPDTGKKRYNIIFYFNFKKMN